MALKALFTRRWLLATVLVLAAMAVMARLGIWQLDRLEQRRAFNDRVYAQLDEPPLPLDAASLDQDLYNMEYRSVVVSGEYLNEEAMVLRNQIWEGEFGRELGVQLFTPLMIPGSDQAILVERGWIPEADASEAARQAYDVEGLVTVQGVLRRAETDFQVNLRPDPTLSEDQDRLATWNRLDLDRIDQQTSVDLLDVYLQRSPQENPVDPPFATTPNLDLGEGPHLGYAIQWFIFAAILGLGYPFYVQRQEKADQEE